MTLVIDIAGRLVGEGHPPWIVAELGINHGGDPELARRLVRAAAEAGAHAVKLQSFDTASFLDPGTTETLTVRGPDGIRTLGAFEVFRSSELDGAGHQAVWDEARAAGVSAFSTPCDRAALDLLDRAGVPCFKISSDYLGHLEFLNEVARRGRPVIVSTGMATLGDVEDALDALVRGGDPPVVLLHCVSAYPAPASEVNLRAMDTLRRAFGVPVGFSDHTRGTTVPIAACAMGACLIEKHFTLDRDGLTGPDHWFSADPSEMSALTTGCREAWEARGDGRKIPAPSEREARLGARLSVSVVRDLAEGETLAESDLAVRRPGTGIPPLQRARLIGWTAARPLRSGQVLSWGDVAPPPGGAL